MAEEMTIRERYLKSRRDQGLPDEIPDELAERLSHIFFSPLARQPPTRDR